jgi:fructose-1,6-bisphosphatase/sedoheptulose 1,7-bisphosphatase-like protein
MADGDITIDRTEIEALITWLTAMGADLGDLNGGGVNSPSSATLDDLTVNAGSADFAAGARVVTAIQKLGTDVLARLDTMRGNATEMADKLREIADRAEQVETLNQLAASEFGTYSTTAGS